MDAVIHSPRDPTPGSAGHAGGETASHAIDRPSEGSLWRAYLTSVLNKPIIREEEVRDEVQTTA